MAAWQVARSLDQLLAQVNELAPRRSKVSDGGIGDAAHATRDSDHNPWFVLAGQSYVTARDYTHDPANLLDCQRLAAALQVGRDQRVKYVIWNRQIMSGAAGPAPWVWRPYAGSNPWLLPASLATPTPAPRMEDDMFTDQDRALLLQLARRDDVGHARSQILSRLGVADPVSYPDRRTPEDIAADQPTIDYDALARALLRAIAG